MNKTLIFFIAVIGILAGLSSSLLLNKQESVQLSALTWFGNQAKTLPEFTLKNHDNQVFTNQSLSGQWDLLFFGYTNCPDICPDTLQTLNTMLNLLPTEIDRNKIHINFISVDPERDSSDKLKAYVTYFNPEFKGISGEDKQINILTDALGILHSREASDSGYNIGHSGALVLIDPSAKYSGIFSAPLDAIKIAHDIAALINSNS